MDDNLIELKAQFNAFLDRYADHQKDALIWRADTTERLKVHCKFINDVSPIYKGLCKVLGVIAVVATGIAVTSILRHVAWK